jgi:hypothetical protein
VVVGPQAGETLCPVWPLPPLLGVLLNIARLGKPFGEKPSYAASDSLFPTRLEEARECRHRSDHPRDFATTAAQTERQTSNATTYVPHVGNLEPAIGSDLLERDCIPPRSIVQSLPPKAVLQERSMWTMESKGAQMYIPYPLTARLRQEYQKDTTLVGECKPC